MAVARRSIAIIGAGFGGLAVAYYLKRAGFDQLTLFEKSRELGGVWRDNTYPGAACDIPAHLYSFSFERAYPWSRRFPPQPEILEYLRTCARKHDLVRHIRFESEVQSASFDERRGLWRLELGGGRSHEAHVLIAAVGQLQRPAIPDIKGRDTFAGPAFHSARWDHGCALPGKRIAVVGTGASAVQFVPEIAADAAQLHVFQRSAPWTWPKVDHAYSPRERRLLDVLPRLQQLDRAREFSTFDSLNLAAQPEIPTSALARSVFEKVALGHLADQVSDLELRRKLTPDYPLGCKRALLTDGWLPALSRPNVELVTELIDEISPRAVHTRDGRWREVDVLIWGTGFAATEFLAPMELRGLGGRSLQEQWRGGASAYLGMAVSGFPNLFILYGPNTNLGLGSVIYMLERQGRYITRCVQRLSRTGARYLDVLPAAEGDFGAEIRRRSARTVFEGGCRSWYLVNGVNTNNWVGTMAEYALRTRRPNWKHFELTC